MKVTANMAEAIIKDVNKLETAMPDIKAQLGLNVTELLGTAGIIGSDDIQPISKSFDDVLGLLQKHDEMLLSFIRSMVKSGTMPKDVQDKVKDARQRVHDMSGEIAWNRERISSQIDIHNAGLGCFTFLSVVKGPNKSQIADMDAPAPESANEPVLDAVSAPAPDDASNLVSEDTL